MSTGTALRDAGLRQLELAAYWSDWPRRAEDFVRREIAAGHMVDADRVREACGDPDRSALLGGLFRKLAHEELIRRVGVRPADRPERRAGLLSIWGPATETSVLEQPGRGVS